jgi:hypothetical protein
MASKRNNCLAAENGTEQQEALAGGWAYVHKGVYAAACFPMDADAENIKTESKGGNGMTRFVKRLLAETYTTHRLNL